jgi:hypothetical protein
MILQCFVHLTNSYSILYLKLKENTENDMAAHAICAVFCSSHQPSQIGPTAEKDSAAVPSPIFFLLQMTGSCSI